MADSLGLGTARGVLIASVDPAAEAQQQNAVPRSLKSVGPNATLVSDDRSL
jgi:hypothetical protein